MSVFDDQAEFMQSCGQTVGLFNLGQVVLYKRLIDEEVNRELMPAIDALLVVRKITAEQLAAAADGALDAIVVAIGLLHSIGVDPRPLWDEVVRSNRAKVDPTTGMVRKREDGKVLKPEGWQPPQLARIIEEQLK